MDTVFAKLQEMLVELQKLLQAFIDHVMSF